MVDSFAKAHAMQSKLTGDRLREARELCGMSQRVAAERLGYANGSRLARIERAVDAVVPILLIRRAAILYEVSSDWLLGLSDDWSSTASGRDLSAYLLRSWERQRSLDMAAVARLHDEIVAVKRGVESCVSMAVDVESALERFAMANGAAYFDFPCGAPLAAAIDRMARESERVRRHYQRFKERSTVGLPTQQLSMHFED